MTDTIITSGAFGQILHFDPLRTRPGIRDLLNQAGVRIADAIDQGAWVSHADVFGQQALRDHVPEGCELIVMDDIEVANQAEEVSLLALQAIHSGDWPDLEQISFLMELQSVALRLAARMEARSA